MIQNLDTRLNKLQTQCDYLRHKLSTFPEGAAQTVVAPKHVLNSTVQISMLNSVFIILFMLYLLLSLI